MSNYQWWRRWRGGYWIKFIFGWTKVSRASYDYYWHERTMAGLSETIENWELGER